MSWNKSNNYDDMHGATKKCIYVHELEKKIIIMTTCMVQQKNCMIAFGAYFIFSCDDYLRSFNFYLTLV